MSEQSATFLRNHTDAIFSWYDHPMPAPVNDVMFSNIQALYTGKLTPEEYAALMEEAVLGWR